MTDLKMSTSSAFKTTHLGDSSSGIFVPVIDCGYFPFQPTPIERFAVGYIGAVGSAVGIAVSIVVITPLVMIETNL